MRDFETYRKAARQYWERRRIAYNLWLILPALFGYGFEDTLNWVGDRHETNHLRVAALFALSAAGANVCYSLVYALEFLFGSDDPDSRWIRSRRTNLFVAGVLFAMLLAFIGGRNVADLEWRFRTAHQP